MSERSGGHKRSEQSGASKQVSGASERANGRASVFWLLWPTVQWDNRIRGNSLHRVANSNLQKEKNKFDKAQMQKQMQLSSGYPHAHLALNCSSEFLPLFCSNISGKSYFSKLKRKCDGRTYTLSHREAATRRKTFT